VGAGGDEPTLAVFAALGHSAPDRRPVDEAALGKEGDGRDRPGPTPAKGSNSLDSTYYPSFTEGTGGGAASWSPWVRSCRPASLHPRIGMGAADPDYALRCLAVL